MTFQHYLLGLFAVANNIPALPLHMNLCRGIDVPGQHRMCSVATGSSFVTMVVSLVIGAAVLEFFGISIAAFRIAGGLLLVTSGLGMLKSKCNEPEGFIPATLSEMIPLAVVPIAIPLTTGAGTMSTIILFAESAGSMNGLLKIAAAIGGVSVVNYLTFFYSPVIVRFLGHTGMDIFTKIFGLITLALGIQFIITGLAAAFPALH
ncbi:MarC family protein [Desulfovibrio sp. TomC]|uniref:MarC family protein n=1 Tax=Desulfovibrio sp. TomC TaxID=1562888 RepID=UPI001E46FBB7|nr:MarC family protein [Desulfovibrio sp. TomC]